MAQQYNKDSSIIEMVASEDGYFIRVWKWPTSPPPVPYRNLTETLPEIVDGGFRQDHTAEDKTELKLKLTQFVDAVFDI